MVFCLGCIHPIPKIIAISVVDFRDLSLPDKLSYSFDHFLCDLFGVGHWCDIVDFSPYSLTKSCLHTRDVVVNV